MKAVILLLFLVACAQQQVVTVQDDAQVDISGFAFSPAVVKIAQGSTVTWTNKDALTHTVTGRSFDSGHLDKGASWSKKFDEKGTFEYGCSIHPTMKGTIIVE
ncbi:Halocyanin [uncultured archaeon]|nr:Halocyanin [uncultured archaeon]